MAAEEEILKYRLDVSDVEAKAQRLNELLEQIKAKQTTGGDTSELEAQFGREFEGLGRLISKQKEGAGSAEELIKQKEKLAAVTRVLGGNFSGMVGDLGGIIELMLSATPAAAGMAAALAGITFAVKAIKEYRAEVEALEAKLKEMEQARREAGGELGGPFERIQRDLAAAGRLDTGTARQGLDIAIGYGKMGLPMDIAAGLAVPTLLAGATGEQRTALAAAGIAGRQFAGAADVTAFLRALPAEGAREAGAQMEALLDTPLGREARFEAAFFARQLETDPTIQGMVAGSQDYLLFTMARRLGLKPPGVERIDEWRQFRQDLRDKLLGKKDALVYGAHRYSQMGARDLAKWRLLGQLAEGIAALEEMGIFDTTGAEQSSAPSDSADQIRSAHAPGYNERTIQIFNDTRIGTQFNTRDRRRTIGHPTHGAVTVGGSNFGRTNHGM
jgi:hypothetical protein